MQFLGDGARRVDLIAGQHHDADARAARRADRVGDTHARRVAHPGEAEKRIAASDLFWFVTDLRGGASITRKAFLNLSFSRARKLLLRKP
jgi:hypothetical protein